MNLLVVGHLSPQFPIPTHNNLIRFKASLQGLIPQSKESQLVIWGKYNQIAFIQI
jgi:hypothetical protein